MTDEEIDELIKQWHEDSGGSGELHEYLGWTWDQYCEWVEGKIQNVQRN